jgi:hypothetical protein
VIDCDNGLNGCHGQNSVIILPSKHPSRLHLFKWFMAENLHQYARIRRVKPGYQQWLHRCWKEMSFL